MTEQKDSREKRFVEGIITRLESDRGLAAKLRRADNPASEYQSWEYLSRFHIDLTKERERKVFCTIAAAVARAKPKADGNMGLGKALARLYETSDNEQAQSKLRRLLACTAAEEACDVLRPYLSLLASKGIVPSYTGLLQDLLYFNSGKKEKWAQDFFSHGKNQNPEE